MSDQNYPVLFLVKLKDLEKKIKNMKALPIYLKMEFLHQKLKKTFLLKSLFLEMLKGLILVK